MAPRSESVFAFLALLLLLSLTLLYGCRAYDPQPPIINRAPDTYITGGPAETTGTSFTRHMWWYGTDVDGEVVQFIYAITDSTIRNLEDEQNRDEEDDRFNPAVDVTTLETTEERFVGWTTKTDSVFQFTVDRGPTASKDMTFHIVAVDDRGAIDPTPARLYFFNNSLGNPRITFRLYADVGTGPEPEWELRWVGDHRGQYPESPEGTEFPFAGYERRFRIDWEASSPNGEIVGYRYRTKQGLAPLIPPIVDGEKQWDPDTTGFVFSNEIAPSTDLGANCQLDGLGCDPAVVRFPSGNYNITVEALDVALVESDVGTGNLEFGVNYPPETALVSDGQYPNFEVRDQSGQVRASGLIAEGDTVPANATVRFRSSGYDKFAGSLPPGVPSDSLCCDTPLGLMPGDPDYVPEVRYQSRLVTVRREAEEPGGRRLSNTFSDPEPADTISFWTGPLDYTYDSRTVDEHRRADLEPAKLSFVAGFRPRVREDLTIPGGDMAGNPGDIADTLLISVFPSVSWADNEVPYTLQSGVTKYFLADPGADCGGVLIDVPEGETPPEGAEPQFGANVHIRFSLIGEQDPRDPLSPIKAWSYAIFSDKDPENEIEDGLESRDLGFFVDSPLPNEWDFEVDEAITLWFPLALQANSVDYHPSSTKPTQRSIGCILAKRMGNMTFRVRGRTTGNLDVYNFYQGTRKSPGGQVAQILIGDFGRQSGTTELTTLKFLLGGGTSTTPAFYWPDF